MAIAKEVDDKVAEYDREYKTIQDSIRQIELEIDANQRSLRRIEANNVLVDETGRIIRSAYPPVYFQLQQDIVELEGRKRKEQGRIDELRVSAKAIKAKVPTPRYTGAQRLIGPEEAPGLPPLEQPNPLPQTTAPPVSQPVNAGPPPRAHTP